MNTLTKPELTPTRIERNDSTPQSTRPGEEADRVWPNPESATEPGWSLDLPVAQSPPEDALIKIVMTFGHGVVRMEAADIGVTVEGDKAPSTYGRLIDAVRMRLEASGERPELLRYAPDAPDAWFKFVPPDQARSSEHPKRLSERFNEAYDEEAKREDEEFVKNVKRYHRKRFSDEW